MPDWREVARRKAAKYGLDPDIFVRQIGAESGFDPRAQSPAGASGIAQIMPATAAAWGVNPWKPRPALDAAARNMASYVKKYGGYENALRAYNAGPGAIQASRGYAETNAYVDKILTGGDPGKLGQPRRGNNRQAGGGGSRRGQPVTLSSVVSTPGAVISPPPDNGLLASLMEQRAPQQQVQVSAPDPVSFGADRYLRGASAGTIPSSGAPVRQESGLAGMLAQLGQAPSITVPGSQKTVTTTGRPRGGGGVGKTLVLGDSLGVGTAPELRQMGVKITANVKEGRSSQKGVSVLRNLLRGGDYQNIVFDLGTNDGTAQQLKTSLRQALRLAPGATFYVPTVNGPGAAAKNRAIKQVARNNPNVQLVRWHGASKGGQTLSDGIHGGYEDRAQLLAGALGVQPRQSSGGGARKGWGVQPRGTLRELFYNGPGAAVNVDEGQRVGKGFVSGHDSHVHVAADPKTVREIGRMAQRMGLTVRENKAFDPVDPVHTDGSFHYQDMAADISGDPRLMAALTRRVAKIYGV